MTSEKCSHPHLSKIAGAHPAVVDDLLSKMSDLDCLKGHSVFRIVEDKLGVTRELRTDIEAIRADMTLDQAGALNEKIETMYIELGRLQRFVLGVASILQPGRALFLKRRSNGLVPNIARVVKFAFLTLNEETVPITEPLEFCVGEQPWLRGHHTAEDIQSEERADFAIWLTKLNDYLNAEITRTKEVLMEEVAAIPRQVEAHQRIDALLEKGYDKL